MWSTNPLLFCNKCLAGENPPYWVLPYCGGGGGGRETVSLPFLPIFTLCCGQQFISFLDLFLGGNNPYVPVELVCLREEVSSGSSYAAILDLISWIHKFFLSDLPYLFSFALNLFCVEGC